MSTPKYKGKRIHVTCPQDIYKLFSELARKESRTDSQMMLVLAKEAMISRGISLPDDDDDDDE